RSCTPRSWRCRAPCRERPHGWSAGSCGRVPSDSTAVSRNKTRNPACWRDSAYAVLIDKRARHSIDFLALPEFLPGRADIAVALVVIGKVLAREGAVGMLGFVEHGDVRLDPLLIDQPVQHLGRSLGGVADEALGVEVDACNRPLDHALGRRRLGLTDRGR